MDSISYALTIELNAPLTHHTHYTPKIFLFITHSLYFGGLGNMSLHDRAPFFYFVNGSGEKSFLQHYQQWFLYNPDR
jgi:hypothetical protein